MAPTRLDLPLDRVQAWMSAVLLHGGTTAEALASPEASAIVPADRVGDLLRPSRSLDAAGRLRIYHAMIASRFESSLGDAYPALRSALGDRFPSLVRDYAAGHPSRSFTLADLGAALPSYLSGWDGLDEGTRTALADLARLEQAAGAAWDLPASRALSARDLDAVPERAWEEAVLEPVPSLRIVTLGHDANAVYEEFMQGGTGGVPRRAERRVAVYRRGGAVRRLPLDRRGSDLLHALCAGLPLGAALSRCRGARPERIRRWLAAWVAAGLFRTVTLPRKPEAGTGHPSPHQGGRC